MLIIKKLYLGPFSSLPILKGLFFVKKIKLKYQIVHLKFDISNQLFYFIKIELKLEDLVFLQNFIC
jgi:hypothetical protein